MTDRQKQNRQKLLKIRIIKTYDKNYSKKTRERLKYFDVSFLA